MTLDQSTIAAITAAAPRVHNGTYTVTHPRSGHFTVKLHTAQRGALKGKRILSLLTGPDNQHDFTGVAFWSEDAVAIGSDLQEKTRCAVHVWNRWKGDESRTAINGYTWQKNGWSVIEKKLAMWCDLALRGEKGYWIGEGCTILRASRCVRCNRELTHPESIAYGIGPECAGRATGGAR